MSTISDHSSAAHARVPALTDDLHRYSVDPARGFLPSEDPLRQLPAEFAVWEEVAADLPKLLATQRVRSVLRRIPILDPSSLTWRELDRAMLLLSFLGHACVWEHWREAAQTLLPASVAIPWYQVAQKLDRPPVLSYASYALDNWRRIDETGPIELGNVALLQNFLGGLDEEWFVAVHIAIEARAAPALGAMLLAQDAVAAGDSSALETRLRTIHAALEAMHATLLRMPENCDPYIYFHRVRPYIHGFSETPVVYEGVEAYAGQPQSFYGETGAQSAIVPALDAALGIAHSQDDLGVYLTRMRDYMPVGHRAFLARIESGPSIRGFVLERGDARLRDAYNACIRLVEAFRTKHLEYAAIYIQKQAQHGPYNSTHYGTGGTPFMKYLKKHRDETEQQILRDNAGGVGDRAVAPKAAPDAP
jgi:indoleamine 2,3-dioxygenase